MLHSLFSHSLWSPVIYSICFTVQAAIIRIGLNEMIRFSKLLFPTVSDATFFESCGVADLITTCCNFLDHFSNNSVHTSDKDFVILDCFNNFLTSSSKNFPYNMERSPYGHSHNMKASPSYILAL